MHDEKMIRELLPDYLRDRLSGDEKLIVESALEESEHVRCLLGEFKKYNLELSTLKPILAPDNFIDAINNKIDKAQKQSFFNLFKMPLEITGALAVSILLITLFNPFNFNSPTINSDHFRMPEEKLADLKSSMKEAVPDIQTASTVQKNENRSDEREEKKKAESQPPALPALSLPLKTASSNSRTQLIESELLPRIISSKKMAVVPEVSSSLDASPVQDLSVSKKTGNSRVVEPVISVVWVSSFHKKTLNGATVNSTETIVNSADGELRMSKKDTRIARRKSLSKGDEKAEAFAIEMDFTQGNEETEMSGNKSNFLRNAVASFHGRIEDPKISDEFGIDEVVKIRIPIASVNQFLEFLKMKGEIRSEDDISSGQKEGDCIIELMVK
jgi:hypothetical protein